MLLAASSPSSEISSCSLAVLHHVNSRETKTDLSLAPLSLAAPSSPFIRYFSASPFLHWHNRGRTPLFEKGIGKSRLPRSLTSRKNIDLLQSVDAFLFNCNGDLWKGNNLIDGVPETLKVLRSIEKKLVFVVDASTKSRRQSVQKFRLLTSMLAMRKFYLLPLQQLCIYVFETEQLPSW